MFDKLMIMNKGKIAFFGKAGDSVDYYRNLGYTCKKEKNPIDFFIDIAIKGSQDTDRKFFNHYANSTEIQVNKTI